MGYLGLLVVFVALAAIFLLFMGDLRGKHRSARILRDFERYGGTASWNSLFAGGLSAIAAGIATNTVGLDWGVSLSAGAAVGAIFAIATSLHLTALRTWVAGVLGGMGLVAVVIGLFVNPGCAQVPLWERVGTLLLVVVAGAVGFLLRALRGRWPRMTTLALFGALKTALFLAAPLGIAILDLGWPGWIVGFGGAILLGFLASYGPDVVIALSTASILIASLASSVAVGGSCTAGPQLVDLAPVIGFSVTYAIVWLAMGLVRRR